MSCTGLQSVYRVKCPPYRYRCRRSTAHTMANASLSICEYLVSTSESALLTYTTTFLSFPPGVFWNNIAESPSGEASVMSSVSFCGSKYAMVASLVNNCFTLSNAYWCSPVQWNGTSCFVSSRSGCDTSLNFGINFAQYVAIPRKLRTPLADVG